MKKNIIQEIQSIQNNINTLKKKYSDTDIRISFLDGMHSNLCHYLLHIEIPTQLYFEHIYAQIFKVEKFKKGDLILQKQNIINNANSTLIIDSWSNFELFISYLSKSCLSKELQDQMKSKDYDSIIKCLAQNKLDGTQIECLRKRIITDYDLIQSNLKIQKMISHIEDRFESKVKCRDTRIFLENFGRLRNCIHSNYIFHGKEEVEFQFEEILMKYTPNLPIYIIPESPDLIYRLVKDLRIIGEFIIDNTDFPDLIFDPSHLLVIP